LYLFVPKLDIAYRHAAFCYLSLGVGRNTTVVCFRLSKEKGRYSSYEGSSYEGVIRMRMCPSAAQKHLIFNYVRRQMF